MDADLQALLALQADDDVVQQITAKMQALDPALAALDAERGRAVNALDQTRAQAETDERRKRELEQRLSEHKEKQERNLAQLDLVKRMREATAAMSQVETGRKILLEGENEVRAIGARVADARRSIAQQEEALLELDGVQADARERIATERAALQGQLTDARAVRDAAAASVPSTLLAKYDRIRGRRRSQAVFALSSGACSACDTSIPVQKRNIMASKNLIDVCEACGVLLYATD